MEPQLNLRAILVNIPSSLAEQSWLQRNLQILRLDYLFAMGSHSFEFDGRSTISIKKGRYWGRADLWTEEFVSEVFQLPLGGSDWWTAEG